MFHEPLRRDPLVVGWAVVMLLGAFVALSNNTEWSGDLDPDRVAGFLKDLADAFLWSFMLLLLLAWLRARLWRVPSSSPRRSGGAARRATQDAPPLPWTDRWLRDWREAEARQRTDRPSGPPPAPSPVVCRHGAPLDVEGPAQQAPVLQALSVSHTIVRPGSQVSVTWCFQNCRDVVVDGRGGHPSCGEALVQIDTSRRIQLVGRNRYGTTPVATATVVAMTVPQLDLPTVAAPPPVSLRTDVAATVGASTPITQRLDDFWATQERLRPRVDAPARVVGVPASVVDGLRRARRTSGKG
ncbi:hypothetical protein [Geodermatophilus sp. CPCC 205506]|uniref:hypothetical protein n=1 Tax=Geodermatophilus sp. CPCC 205506 TaxID=2936596 RepID=UPI003EEA07F6